MTPEQLQQTAHLLREHCPPPSPHTMTPGEYVVSEGVYRLAAAVEEIARRASGGEKSPGVGAEPPKVVRAPRPPLDDEFLRREALDLAVRAQRGQEGGAEIVARAEILLGFLRGDPPSREAQEEAAWKAGER